MRGLLPLLSVTLLLMLQTLVAEPCPVITARDVKHIKELRPSDVKVMLALGDSITAAFSAYGMVLENRGASWSIGGDSNTTTLPNIIANITTNKLVGMSVGSHVPELPGFPYYENDFLNAAQSTAKIQHLPAQVLHLYNTVKKHPEIDVDNDWKIMTVLIGANDACRSCDPDYYKLYVNPDEFEKQLRTTLNEVRSLFPKTFVNAVLLFNISQVYDIASPIPYCMRMHKLFSHECPCLFNGSPNDRAFIDVTVQEYNRRIEKVAKDYIFDDFAVVVQPGLEDMTIPSIDFLSMVDCFHPRVSAHQAMAIALFNNMIVPAAQKKRAIHFGDDVQCPGPETTLQLF